MLGSLEAWTPPWRPEILLGGLESHRLVTIFNVSNRLPSGRREGVDGLEPPDRGLARILKNKNCSSSKIRGEGGGGSVGGHNTAIAGLGPLARILVETAPWRPGQGRGWDRHPSPGLAAPARVWAPPPACRTGAVFNLYSSKRRTEVLLGAAKLRTQQWFITIICE